MGEHDLRVEVQHKFAMQGFDRDVGEGLREAYACVVDQGVYTMPGAVVRYSVESIGSRQVGADGDGRNIVPGPQPMCLLTKGVATASDQYEVGASGSVVFGERLS